MVKYLFSLLICIPLWIFGQTKSIEEGMKAPLEVRHLKLKRDRLSVFPEEILQFENLEILDLSNNRLITLPSSIAQLKKLKKIILAKNNFVEFPMVLLSLDQLEYIDLWDNFIENLPAEVKTKRNLSFLDIRGVLLMPEVYNDLRTWFSEDTLKISPPCDCMYK